MHVSAQTLFDTAPRQRDTREERLIAALQERVEALERRVAKLEKRKAKELATESGKSRK